MKTLPKVSFPPFRPHPLLRRPHTQTLFAAFFPGGRSRPGRARHELTLPDGDRLILQDDFADDWRPGDPTALLMHGLAGCHQSGYMVRMVRKLVPRGWRVFRLDHRGTGAGAHLASRPYNAGRVDDVQRAITWIAEMCPDSPQACIGFSLSGNLVLKLLARRKTSLPANLKTAIAVSPAIDLLRAAENIRCKSNRVYDRHFTRKLWRMVPHYSAVRDELPHLLGLQTIPASLYEFDQLVTAPLGGFANAEDYYTQSSSLPDLPEIELETLIITSADDPLVPGASFREAILSESTHLLLTEAGGHLGFVGRRCGDPDRRWMDWRAIEWLEAVMNR